MASAYAIAVAGLVLLGVILLRGVQEGMLRRFRAFYTLIGFVAVVEWVRMMILMSWGVGSRGYYLAYYGPTFAMPFLQILAIAEMWQRICGDGRTARPKMWRAAAVSGLLTLPVLLSAAELEGTAFFYRFHLVALFAQMVGCLLVCREVARVGSIRAIGPNLVGMLTGMSLMVGSQAINFAFFAFGQTADVTFWFLVPFLYFLSLGIFAGALWHYQPVRPEGRVPLFSEDGLDAEKAAK